MKYNYSTFAAILGITFILWPIFRSDFTNTQLVLSVIFAYLAIRLIIYTLKK